MFAAALAWTVIKEESFKKSLCKLLPNVTRQNTESIEMPSAMQNHWIADLLPDNLILNLTKEEIVECVEEIKTSLLKKFQQMKS